MGKPLSILIVSQYFWPENFIINDLAKKLSDTGHTVTVATGKPNYPSGEIAEGYSKKGVAFETFADNVEIIRVPMYPRGSASGIRLALNYLSFALSASFRLPALLEGRKFDVIFVFCVSPLTAALPALRLRNLTDARTVLWIQDLWPNSIVATGHIRNRMVLKMITAMVRFIYRRADKILVQSQSFMEPIRSLAPGQSVDYFPNFAPDIEDRKTLPQSVVAQLEDYFCVVFTGNLGKAQSLETIVKAAEKLRHQRDVRFVVAGNGSRARQMADSIESKGLDNVILLGELSKSFMPDLMGRADLLLITLSDDPVLDLTVPSKLQAYMQAGRPVVGAVNGEAARQIELAQAGRSAPAEDFEGLAKIISDMKQISPDQRMKMGESARTYYEENFEPNKALDRLVDLLHKTVDGETT